MLEGSPELWGPFQNQVTGRWAVYTENLIRVDGDRKLAE